MFFNGFGAIWAVNLDSPCFSASVAPFSIPKDALGGTDVIDYGSANTADHPLLARRFSDSNWVCPAAFCMF